MSVRSRTRTLMCGAALAVAASGASPARGDTRARFDTRVLAHIQPPGFAALSLVTPDGTIYAGTFENPAGDSSPSRVFEYSSDGTLERSWTIAGQILSSPHGVQVAARDASGLLYLLDQTPSRIVTLDPRTGVQREYATFSDVPPCAAAPAGSECSDTVMDNPPEPDYAAWGPDGSLYVTDYQQGLIWRVPPGGGKAHVWFTDPALDGTMFGPAGIVLMPDRKTLEFSASAAGASTGTPADGRLWRLPIQADGKPGTLHQVWESGAREGPDGFALAQSGNVYLALVGPGANQIVELSPEGKELARFPDAATNTAMTVPFDEPSSVQFDGLRLIVTNNAYFDGNMANMVLFDIWAGESGAPIFVPPGTGGAAGGQTKQPRLRVSVYPHHVRAGVSVRVIVGVSAAGAPVAGALVTFAGHRARTDSRGHAFFSVVLRTRGTRRVRATHAGDHPGTARIAVTAAR